MPIQRYISVLVLNNNESLLLFTIANTAYCVYVKGENWSFRIDRVG